MKRRASLLLGLVTVVFTVLTIVGPSGAWVPYVKATAEAAMVGGIADWFAITALFRHPFGVPIPHTAIISQRKDDFGRTLAAFVQENFLNADVVIQRLRSTHSVERAAAWLAEPDNAAAIASTTTELLGQLAENVSDDDLARVVDAQLRNTIDAVPLSDLAGRVLGEAVTARRHEPVVDAALRHTYRMLAEQRDTLQAHFRSEAPWWLPDSIEDRIFDRLLDRALLLLSDMTEHPEHRLRRALDEQLVALTQELRTSPQLMSVGEELKQQLFTGATWHDWVAMWTTRARDHLVAETRRPDSDLQIWIAGAVTALAARYQDDRRLQKQAEDALERGIAYAVTRFESDIAQLVSGTIAHWDPEETSDKLELLLGRDLQFIRINGTIVGGLAGLAIFTLARLAA